MDNTGCDIAGYLGGKGMKATQISLTFLEKTQTSHEI